MTVREEMEAFARDEELEDVLRLLRVEETTALRCCDNAGATYVAKLIARLATGEHRK
jgi:hypothetical protein